MEISDLLQPQSVLAGVRVASKKEALSVLARQAASRTGQPERAILDALVERERLGLRGLLPPRVLTMEQQVGAAGRWGAGFWGGGAGCQARAGAAAAKTCPLPLPWLNVAAESAGPGSVLARAGLHRPLAGGAGAA